jgi:hypothetical protein
LGKVLQSEAEDVEPNQQSCCNLVEQNEEHNNHLAPPFLKVDMNIEEYVYFKQGIKREIAFSLLPN